MTGLDAIRGDLRAVLPGLWRDARRAPGDENSRDAKQMLAYAEARIVTIVERASADG
jgi:hypothetical protein